MVVWLSLLPLGQNLLSFISVVCSVEFSRCPQCFNETKTLFFLLGTTLLWLFADTNKVVSSEEGSN